MSLDLGNLSAPVANVDDLVGYIKGAERPPDRWLIGVEHEKIGVRVSGYQAVPDHGPGGIRELLDAIARSAGGTQHKHKENGQPIALLSKDASATLEPGGQLELSGAPSRSLDETGKEIEDHLAEVRKDSAGIAWLAAGYRPFGTTADARWGLLEPMLQPGWGYQRYVDWALDVPMLFVRSGTDYHGAQGQTFRDWLATGRLAGGEKTQPTLSHWADHLSTLFPEVRVKRV